MPFLRAILASFLPEKLRKHWQPGANVRGGAIVSGLLEFLLFGYVEWLRFHGHLLAVAEYFGQGNEGTQTAALFVMMLSEFFYPLSLLCIVLAVEGLVRFLAAVIVGEIVPSVFISLAAWVQRKSMAKA